MSVCQPGLRDCKLSFFNVDSIYDYLLSIGMRPIVELSFMPAYIASNNGQDTIFWYKGITDPPADYNAWIQLISSFAQHLVDRYGIDEVSQWRFEVWNEPNLDFWHVDPPNKQSEYFKLYNATATAVKSVSAQLQVGGPATAQLQWIPDFLAWSNSNGVPVDFVSSHIYPSDPQVPTNNTGAAQVLMNARAQVTAGASTALPMVITEFNSGLWNLHDTSYASAFLVSLFAQLPADTADVLSYWTFTDIFEEGGQQSTPFQEGFGLQTIHGVPKPAYRALQLFHQGGSERLPASSDDGAVFALPLFNRVSGEVRVCVSNFDVYSGPDPQQRNATVSVIGVLPPANNLVPIFRIDDTHVTPRK